MRGDILDKLHSSKRLIDIGNNVVRMLDADRKPHITFSHAGLELLLRRQLRVSCRGRMNGERAGIADVCDMIEQLQAVDELAAGLFALFKPNSAP